MLADARSRTDGTGYSPSVEAARVVFRLAAKMLLVTGLALVMCQSALTSLAGAGVAIPAALGFALTKGRIRRARLPMALLLFFAWTASSVVWTHDPRSTLRAVVGTALLLALGVLLAWGRSNSQLARLVLCGAAGVALVAIALAFARPTAALREGHLRGLTPHENQLGFIAVVGLVSVLVCVVERRLSWTTACVTGSLFILTLLWSGSKTGLLVTVVTAVSFGVMRAIAGLARPWQAPLVLTTLVSGSLAVLPAVLNRAFVAEALGRDVTLTGRTEIWRVVWLLGREQPLTGYGLGSVWRPSSPVGGTVERAIFYFPSHAHNGYLDTFLQVGAIGVVLLLLVLLRALVRGSGQMLRGGSAWHVSMTVLLILYNLSETRFLDHTGWLLLVIVCTPVAAWETNQANQETGREEGLR